ncbi:MAG: hypothetical protein M1821_000025 [Bathelium mastoideum]|nr:MAG: hypothetical protein M1821_000025 [Bathelium mastoideum]KAI9687945.1 MAG: hypothetical protein M1822_002027 [Bathelium mastoideum]
MDSARSHIPDQPKWFLVFRIIQLILTVIVLALSAYGLATSDLQWDALCLAIFTASVGLPVLIWELVAMTGAPRAYNYWAVLAFEIFLVIFWLVSFASVAALTGAIADATTYTTTFDYMKKMLMKRDFYFYSDIYVSYTYFILLAVNAALGAVNWVMYVVTTVLTSIYVHRHRQAGGHNRPVGLTTFADGAAPAYTSGVQAPEKTAAQDTSTTVYQMPQHQEQQQQSYVTSTQQHQAYVPPQQEAYIAPQQQTYAPSPIHSQAQSDQYPTYAGPQNA